MRIESFIPFGNNIAIIENDNKISYDELHQKSEEVKNYILKIKPNSNFIGLEIDISIDCIIVLLGILKSGYTYVPIDSKTPKLRKDIIKNQLNIELNFTKIKKESQKYVVEKHNNLAYVLSTTGTTGDPKLLQFTHKSNLTFINWAIKEISNKNPRTLNISPLSFDLSIFDIFYTLFQKGTLVIPHPNDKLFPKNIFKLIDKFKINTIYTTPSYLTYLGKKIKSNNNLNYIIFAGEAFHSQQFKLIFNKNKTYYNLYGPTETNVCFYKKIEDPDIISLGQPCPYIKYQIKNNQLYIQGDSLASNIKYPYPTGDLIYIKDNEIYFNGRIDNQVKKMGYRINLDEITATCLKNPKIQFAKTIIKNNKIILKYQSTEKIDIKKYLKIHLPSYMLPDIIKEDIKFNKNYKTF